jgi:hypothetical protein
VGSRTDPPPPSADVQPTPVRFRDGIGYCLAVFLVLRILLGVLSIATIGVVRAPGLDGDQPPPLSPGWHNIIEGTDRWDAKRFVAIASVGYRGNAESAAFFPGYPIAIKIVSAVPGIDEVVAAELISNIAFFGALVVFYALTKRDVTQVDARRTVLLLACFPTSFFFFAPYSESLYLLSSVLAFWWARGDRWVRAGLAGFLAAAVRNVGVLLVPGLLIEAATEPRPRRRTAVLGALLPLAAPIAIGLYWQMTTGDLLAPFHAQEAWHKAFEFPVMTIGHAVSLGVEGVMSARGIYWTIDAIVTAAIVVPIAIRWRVIPPPYLAYVVASLLVIFSYPLPQRPLVSAPRYALVLFPAYWAMADLWGGRAFRVVIASFLVGWVVLAVIFMNWGYVF